jgi:transaldolase
MTKELTITLFAVGAYIAVITRLYASGQIKGITTNPTLMKQAGIKDYRRFVQEVLATVTDIPISFEVLADDFAEMERQARLLQGLGDNIFIKIPVTNTKGQSSAPLIEKLSAEGYQLNITAVLTLPQVETVLQALNPAVPAVVSVFAGRIADTGTDPCPIMRETAAMCRARSPLIESLWASTRELLNIFQAQECGVDIVTVTHDLLRKLPLIGMDHKELSRLTVMMFYDDAVSTGYKL